MPRAEQVEASEESREMGRGVRPNVRKFQRGEEGDSEVGDWRNYINCRL